jgi:hypothetical protein
MQVIAVGNGDCSPPAAQTRTGPIRASGSYLAPCAATAMRKNSNSACGTGKPYYWCKNIVEKAKPPKANPIGRGGPQVRNRLYFVLNTFSTCAVGARRNISFLRTRGICHQVAGRGDAETPTAADVYAFGR